MYYHLFVFAMCLVALVGGSGGLTFITGAAVVAVAVATFYVIYRDYLKIREAYAVVKSSGMVVDWAVKKMKLLGITKCDLMALVDNGAIDYLNSTPDNLHMFSYSIRASFLVKPGYLYGSYTYVNTVDRIDSRLSKNA